MKRKLLALLLAGTLAAGMLASCGNGEGTAADYLGYVQRGSICE